MSYSAQLTHLCCIAIDVFDTCRSIKTRQVLGRAIHYNHTGKPKRLNDSLVVVNAVNEIIIVVPEPENGHVMYHMQASDIDR